MSHISILSAPLPSAIRTSTDDAYFHSQPGSSKQSLTVPESFLRPSRSRSNSIHPHQYGVNSLPGSPVSTTFPQRPAFRRALTSTAASSVSSEQSRFDDLHYSQTHFSRSTLLVYPDSEATLQPSGEEQDGDIRELLASSDEESSLPPSTPGFETTKIPPRGSSVSLTTKQSMESDKSVYSESIVLAPAPKQSQDKLSGLLAGKAARTSVSSYNDASIRSNASSDSSKKRRSRILMKIIPFARESSSPAVEAAPRFSTFPRARSKGTDEPLETLADRFSGMAMDSLSPPSSASSFTSTFSSTPATSPEMGMSELPARRSGSHGRREGCRLKGTSSRESVRTLFSSPSSGSLTAKVPSHDEESEWERTLQSAASRASWQSSINHRPRPHAPASSGHSRTASQSTWPRAISKPVHQRDSLLLEHVFVDASDDGVGSYAESAYSRFPADHESSYDPRSRGPSVVSSSSYAPPVRRPARHGQAPSEGQEELGQGRFGTLPRVKTRRPSTTGTSVRGEPARFELQPSAPQRPVPVRNVVLGTASLGRATSLRRRPETTSIWQMGRRRSSGVGSLSHAGSFSAGAARMMPTIPQGHSRETSLADSVDDGIDPCEVGDELFARGYSVRHDSLASDGSGEWIPLRFGSWRRESQDDLALLSPARRDSFVQRAAAPVFNLTPFRRPTMDAGRRDSRSAQVPDVPEAVTSETEEDGIDLEGWCRRRSTFSDQIHQSPARTAPALAF
ncbi:uncharacterized protein PSANT_05283 [Moesziomyces antarcticus]|nr:uncharacterized protein PSANT_05283 [Moesziomyces antarcticus]